MSKISIAMFDNHGKIIPDGIDAMLVDNPDMEITDRFTSSIDLYAALKSNVINVLIVVVYDMDDGTLELIMSIASEYVRTKVLVISFDESEQAVFKSIKSGVKGFLTKDAGRRQLIEAVYTLRSGHDFFTQPITNILLNSYLTAIKTEHKDRMMNFKQQLSSREMEILKLWCNSLTNKEIADKLFISVRTVESHKNHIMQKLNMKTTVDIVKFAIKNNIIKID